MPKRKARGASGRRSVTSALRDQINRRRVIADQVISLANLLGRPVLDDTGRRVGRVNDLVVRWDSGVSYPVVVGVLIKVGRGFALAWESDVTLAQSEVRLLHPQLMLSRPVRRAGDVALARDVLDHQLVDVSGVQVVRAADVYLLRSHGGWELAGVDVGLLSFLRRLLRHRRKCPTPNRTIDWAELQAFVPRFVDSSLPPETEPAAAAGDFGASVMFGVPAANLKKLKANDIALLLADLGRGQQAQVAALATPSAAVEAMRELDPALRDALLAELDEQDRARLQAMLAQYDGR